MTFAPFKNRRRLVVLTLYGLATLLVCGAAWHRYALLDATLPVRVARASAAAVYLNSALVLLPMLRFLLSVRLVRRLAGILPLHFAIEAHVIVGSALAVFAAIHVGAYGVLYATNGQPWWPTITARTANETGIALALLLAALIAGTRFRRSARFENFYLSHFLSVPFIALCFWHAPKFVAWAALPVAIYLADRFVRFFWMTEPASRCRRTTPGQRACARASRPWKSLKLRASRSSQYSTIRRCAGVSRSSSSLKNEMNGVMPMPDATITQSRQCASSRLGLAKGPSMCTGVPTGSCARRCVQLP